MRLELACGHRSRTMARRVAKVLNATYPGTAWCPTCCTRRIIMAGPR